MNVIHVCNSDIKGGAAQAAFRINNALVNSVVNSEMLVQQKISKSEFSKSIVNSGTEKYLTYSRIAADLFQMKLFTKEEKGRFSFWNLGTDISKNKLIQNADVIHLHWINEGFLSSKSFYEISKLNKPVVWTLHDMWAFTGGCHYSSGCENFKTNCGNCPYLKFQNENDFSRKIWNKKNEIYPHLNLTIVTCSNWLAEIAKSSSLLRNHKITAIPNPINQNSFHPIEKISARKESNLPFDKKLILFGTMNLKDERKGFSYLKKSLEILKDKLKLNSSGYEIVIFGRAPEDLIKELPFKVNFLGRLSETSKINLCYNAADVFVAPSLEDNLPNTVMESLACGTPVVAFNIGGMPDMIDHKSNGYLANNISADELAEGIFWILEDENRLAKFRENSREKVLTNFTPEIVGNQYKELYEEVLKK